MSADQQKRVRCFFAILLEAQVHELCKRVINKLKTQPGADKVKWLASHQIHLTLHFLGHIPESKAHQLGTSLIDQLHRFESFSVAVKDLVMFPPKNPHTVVIPLAINDKLSELHQVIGDVLKAQGLQLEQRPYSPHITLGRFKKRPNIDLSAASALLPQHINITHIALMRSDLTQEGSIHSVIQDCWLEDGN